MLNKEICIKCIKTFYTPDKGWLSSDDEVWNKYKRVWCPHAPTMEEYETNRSIEIIPTWCIFKVEHIVLGADNESK